MNISILYKFRKGPWGGTNQFLQALRKEFLKMKFYREDEERADVILFNSYPSRSEYYFDKIFKIKKKYPSRIVIYRLDGPISLYRGKDKEVDRIIAVFNKLFADGIIFQSNWCKEKNKRHFNILSGYETVIHNSPDNEMFNRKGRKEFDPDGKIKLVATSWSRNWRKGFDVYKYLDENLNFGKYDMTFVGNSPVVFKNIRWIRPVPPEKVAEILKQHDIFITAARNDPCSNSLIEALSCGLPAVALNDGGSPELVQKGGELFNGKDDIIDKIEKISINYHYYQSQIPTFSMESIAQSYCEFARKIYRDVQDGEYQPKQVNLSTIVNLYKMKFMILRRKVLNKMETVKEKLWPGQNRI